LCVAGGCAQAPPAQPADDTKHLGPPQEFLFWSPEQQVAGYRNIDKVFPTRRIVAGGTPLTLPVDVVDLGQVQIRQGDVVMTVDEYFSGQRVAGLLVIKNGTIVYERYGLGNTEDSRWISFSVAKSVVSMLVGAAIEDGYIASVDEKVTDYLPRLKGSSYDQSTIRNILQMASGVQWNEDYADPESDVNSAPWDTLPLYEYLRHKPVDTEPGTKFNYNTAETNLVGTLLRSAIGNNLSTYLSEKIWRPFGMEADANWMLSEPGGGEMGGCCISATLRDYGRIGLFALNSGRLEDGAQVLPEGWMRESTSPSEAYDGYGYLWWLEGGGTYRASGIFGQGISINPSENVVIAIHSARAAASKDEDWDLQTALYAALTEALTD
jgi:CubicO group peptidase (beta-lactamase class C family)